MSQNIWGGTIFARERSDQARGSVATERGEGVAVGSFFIFRLEKVQSRAYLRRKFRLDDMWVNVSRFDRSGKGYFFHELRNISCKYAPQNFKHMPCTTLHNILIWRRYPDVETRERNEQAWRGCDAVGCHSSAVSLYYLWYGAIINTVYRQTLTLSNCMCMRASGASVLRNFSILTLLNCYLLQFLSIFCRYIENKQSMRFYLGDKRPPKPPTCTPVSANKLRSGRFWKSSSLRLSGHLSILWTITANSFIQMSGT